MLIDLERARARMVDLHLAACGIIDPRLLDAFRSVPRESFLPENLAEFAYEDNPLPIGEGQTISQPYIVAVTVEALGLRGGERVLEVGAGSGYAAAILAGSRGRSSRSRGRVAGDVGEVTPRAPRLLERLRRLRGRVARVAGARPLRRHRRRGRRAQGSAGAALSARDRRTPRHSRSGRTMPPRSSYASRARARPSTARRPRRGAIRAAHRRAGVERRDAREARAESAGAGVALPLSRPLRRGRGRRRTRQSSSCHVAASRAPASSRSSAKRRSLSTTSRRRPSTRSSSGSETRGLSSSAKRRTARAILPDASAHHARAHRATGVQLRRRRGRLARRRAHRRLRPRRSATLAAGVHPVHALPHLDVAERGGPRVRRLAPRLQRRPAGAAGRVPRARPLQPVHLDRGGPLVPRRGRPCAAQRGAQSLRHADPMAEGPRGYGRRSSSGGTGAPRTPSSRCFATCSRSAWSTRRKTAYASSTPRRTPAWSRTPSATTAPCTTARRPRGTSATRTCSTRCARCSRSTARTRRGWSGSTTRTSATRRRPR